MSVEEMLERYKVTAYAKDVGAFGWALRKNSQGEWTVVHEHTSAPIDFETAKVILQRDATK